MKIQMLDRCRLFVLQLMELQSRFRTDDRFRMDARFLEDVEDKQEDKGEAYRSVCCYCTVIYIYVIYIYINNTWELRYGEDHTYFGGGK